MPARLLRAALAAAALATALTPFGTNAAAPCGDESSRTRADGWTVLRRPAFSFGEQHIRSWAASPQIDGYLIATNGTSIARTMDGGCTWEEVYTPGVGIGESGVTMSNSIYDVALPPSPPGRVGYHSWAVVSDLTRTRVVTSVNLGETWVDQPSVGLPPLVNLHGVWVAADPRTAFVLADWQSSLTSLVETTLYVTTDGGLKFTPVKRGLSASQYTRLAVDPIDSKVLWAWDAESLYRSADYGATFTKVDGVTGPISTVDVSHYPAFEPARVIAYRSYKALGSRSDDGGATWKQVTTPGRVTGTSNLVSYGALATASDTGVFVEAAGFFEGLRNASPSKLKLDDVAWSVDPFGLNLYGGNGTDIYVRKFTNKLELPPVELHVGEVISQGPTTFVPANAVIKLKPGERQTIEYRLDLAPVPTPMDIFFATDSTGSMSGVIASLRSDLQDIIDDLGSSGINVWFGIGDFKDYPTFGVPTDHPYKRFREVGPIDEELEEAIESIEIGGGNGLDSALTATYQAATGEGQRRVDLADQGGYWVEPGNGAEWREDALKVLVIAADVRTRDPKNDPGYPGPTYEKVIDALNLLGIKHVGLAVGNSPGEPLQSLSKVSKGTRTLAPAGGIDCDDDGKVDVPAGQPMVCTLSMRAQGTNLAPAMIDLLSSLEDLQPVQMMLSGNPRVARLTGTSLFDAVNVKAHNRLNFTVDTRCDLDTQGETFRYDIDAVVGMRSVAKTALTVVCAGIPPKLRPPLAEFFPPAPVRALAAAAVPPPPPPPAPVPQPQPNPNPNPNPGANPQFGMTYAEQTEVQLALVHQDVAPPGEEDQLAMSALGEDDPALAVLGAGLVLAAGFATSTALRSRAAGRSRASLARTRSTRPTRARW